MKKYYFKRIFAYLIDAFLITLIVSMLNQLNYLNWNYDEYVVASNEYQEVMDNYEVDEIIESGMYQEISYNLIKYGTVYLIIDIVVIIGYIVVFQKFNKGQTIGKKIMSIKVITKDDKDVSWISFLVRTVFIYSIVNSLFSIISINLLSKSNFIFVNDIMVILFSLINFVVFITFIFNKNNMAFHDMIAKTKVVEVENKL